MKAKELAKKLMENPEDEVWGGAWNGYVETYAVLDHTFRTRYDQVSNDFFGTPGRMDKRLFRPGRKDEEMITYVGSSFGRVPNPEVDFGNDDIDYPIKTINGEEGDPNLVWKLSGFNEIEGTWWKTEPGKYEVSYNPATDILMAMNYSETMKFEGKVIGIETARNIISALKIPVTLWT